MLWGLKKNIKNEYLRPFCISKLELSLDDLILFNDFEACQINCY